MNRAIAPIAFIVLCACKAASHGAESPQAGARAESFGAAPHSPSSQRPPDASVQTTMAEVVEDGADAGNLDVASAYPLLAKRQLWPTALRWQRRQDDRIRARLADRARSRRAGPVLGELRGRRHDRSRQQMNTFARKLVWYAYMAALTVQFR